MARIFPSPTAYVRRQGFQRGLIGGSRGWLIVGGTFWGFRVLRHAMSRSERVIATEVLKPGQVLRLEAIPAAKRSERKAARTTSSAR